jgi:coproporphyrinogen III oxidase
MNADAVHAYFAELQGRIVGALELLDGGKFGSDAWARAEGGGGLTRVIEEGNLFERGGVNLSRVQGAQPRARSSRGARSTPWACRWFCTRAIPTAPRCT